jgi:hypothetical protein
MAEMKEKRASMVHQISKPTPPGDEDQTKLVNPEQANPAQTGSVFGKVKLR